MNPQARRVSAMTVSVVPAVPLVGNPSASTATTARNGVTAEADSLTRNVLNARRPVFTARSRVRAVRGISEIKGSQPGHGEDRLGQPQPAHFSRKCPRANLDFRANRIDTISKDLLFCI